MKSRTRNPLPDGETDRSLIAIKAVGTLRLTQQIKLLAYAAYKKKKVLEISIPSYGQVTPALGDFVEGKGGRVVVMKDL